MQLDHVFIRAAPGAPEAEALRAFGLSEGPGNTHPGQGTANRRFFFENGFLELLWVADAAEATSALTRPTMLYERLTSAAARASGIAFTEGAHLLEIEFDDGAQGLRHDFRPLLPLVFRF